MTSDTPEEQRFAELFESLLERQGQGEVIDIDQVCAEFPDLAVDLRELWGAVMVADAVAGYVESVSDAGGPTDAELSTIELPRTFGDYELVEELGRGGMGVVYRGRQISLDRTVAIKMISRGRLASNEDVARFQAEAEATARLDHPGIVSVYEVGQHADQPYFSMKYVQGETLSARLAEGPTVAHAMTKRMLHQEWEMGLDAAIDAEAQAQAICMTTEDFTRAFKAFAAKQKPKFQGD